VHEQALRGVRTLPKRGTFRSCLVAWGPASVPSVTMHTLPCTADSSYAVCMCLLHAAVPAFKSYHPAASWAYMQSGNFLNGAPATHAVPQATSPGCCRCHATQTAPPLPPAAATARSSCGTCRPALAPRQYRITQTRCAWHHACLLALQGAGILLCPSAGLGSVG
jgi:hypothetical protein